MVYTDDYRGWLMTAYPRCPDQPGYCPGSGVPNLYVATWLGTLYQLNYCRNLQVMQCPSDKLLHEPNWHPAYSFYIGSEGTSYGYNYTAFGVLGIPVGTPPVLLYEPFHLMSDVKNPSQTYWAADNADLPLVGNLLYFYGNTYEDIPTWRHNNGLNMLWVDGHVSWLTSIEMRRHAVSPLGSPEYWYDLN